MVQHADIDHTGLTGVGGSDDPISDIFGAADTDHNAADILGLTGLGTPDVESATIVTDHYYVRDANSGNDFCGRYMATPSAPFTAITKLSDFNNRANYMKCGLFLGIATPGNMDLFGVMFNSSRITSMERITPTTYVAGVSGSNVINALHPPVYLGIRVNSSSDVDYLYSFNGRIWLPYLEARNPSITIGSIGVGARAENAAPFGVAFNFLRVWNSAKSFPGVPD